MQRELSQFSQTRELSASQLKRGVYLFRGDLKARVEPDGSSSWVHSATARKLLFGRETAEVFKIQSGVKIAVRPQDALVRATPTEVSHAPRGQDKIQAVHSVRLVTGDCAGSARSVRVTNRGDAVAKLRVLTLHDPTSLNFRRERDPPGEIGVNAFNRHDQVVMDDVGDTTGVRVVGFSPRPSIIYMTKDRSRAAELLALGELPESSLGMSGSVILLTQHDFDLPPGATAEVRSLAVYHPSSLEAALSAAAPRPAEPESDTSESRGVGFASSSASMNFSFEWAKAALFAIEGEGNLAERLWCGVALSLLRGDYFEKLAESIKQGMRKDGSSPLFGGHGNRRTRRKGGACGDLAVSFERLRLSQRAGGRQEAHQEVVSSPEAGRRRARWDDRRRARHLAARVARRLEAATGRGLPDGTHSGSEPPGHQGPQGRLHARVPRRQGERLGEVPGAQREAAQRAEREAEGLGERRPGAERRRPRRRP